MPDHTSEVPRVKRCSRGNDCINPKGPFLPVTAEHWYLNKGKPGAMCKVCHKVWRKANHEQHRERDNARSRKYADENGDKYKHYSAKYYARKLTNGGSYTHADLDTLYKQLKGCCWYCGEFVGLTFDLDHRVPVSQGGSSDISNIVIACRNCNRSKHDKKPQDWNGRLL